MTDENKKIWFQSHNLGDLFSSYKEISVPDIMNLSKEELMYLHQVKGILLYNKLHPQIEKGIILYDNF